MILELEWTFIEQRGGLDVSAHVDSIGKIGSHLFLFLIQDEWTDDMGGKTIFYRGRKVDRMNREQKNLRRV